MPFDRSSTISAFLTAAAAKQPAPGGGSVTALVGALAAAMGEMVVNYSVGKKDLVEHQPKLQHALTELSRARLMLLELMAEDQAAFEALTAARKACNNVGDRDPAFAAALLLCIRIPQSIGATALAILELCSQIAPIGNHFLLSDLAVSAELAIATVRCAAYNVRVNLTDVSDAAERKRFEDGIVDAIRRATQIVQTTMPVIWKRIAASA
jgi:formiminotetrahydrofolate cyclodeaminase